MSDDTSSAYQVSMNNDIEKMTTVKQPPSAFKRLPDEIVEQILKLTDPNSFASLILLNSKWRRISQQAHLYAQHLAQSPSYSASHNALPADLITDDNLPKLRRLFAREVKRNLFEAYLRPNATTIKLVSNSISSSSVPGGDGMLFSPSPRGHHLLAYNSSRIYVLDVRGSKLGVTRELKILRRPVSTCIRDDGSILAVLSSGMQVDLYDLRESPPKRTQSMILDHTPRTIAMSPCGSVLAAAYEGGIEVTSLSPGALPTEKRAVKCDAVDSLAFSSDGTQLLGTTTFSQPPNTVILTAPYYDPGSQMGDDNISALWTTSILFPNTSRDCSHAVLLQESSSEEASWTFTYDRSYETFRAVRIDDLRNGTTYFTGPIPNTTTQPTLLPCTLPAATCCGDLVTAGFEGQDVWLYGIPEDLEAVPEITSTTSESAASGLNRRNSAPSVRSSSRTQETNGGRAPQWQVLCDKYRNTFVSGRKVKVLNGVNAVKWVAGHGKTSLEERLIVTARGIQPPKPITEEDGIDFVDGGRVTILDFDYRAENGVQTEITIEVGTTEPESLDEEQRDMATEVAIVRRRTVAQRRGSRPGILRSATTAAALQAESLLNMPPVPPISLVDELDDPLIPRCMTTAMPGPGSQVPATEEFEDASLEEAQEALDAPYAHASPRSGTTLRRAATAAAVSRRLHPYAATGGRTVYRRADGRAEHPHESDADNWIPPPPPYAKEDPGDLPAFLRHAAIPGVMLSSDNQQEPPPPPSTPPPPVPQTVPPSSGQSAHQVRPELPRIQTSPARERPARVSLTERVPHQNVESDLSNSGNSFRAEDSTRRMSSPSIRPVSHQDQVNDEDDIYDVSPIDPPVQPAQMSATQRPSQDYTPNRRAYNSPQAPSWGTSSSATEYTPGSSSSHPTTAESHDSANPYSLNVYIPSPSFTNAVCNDTRTGSSLAILRLSNPQTWSMVPQQADSTSTTAHTGYSFSAPATDTPSATPIASTLPPAPRADQLASLQNRRDSGVLRRTSGSFQIPRVPVGRNSHDRPMSMRYSQISEIQPLSSEPIPEPEQPLIISTPKGVVTGAFDPPGRQVSHRNNTEPVILAPVPRHPRSTMLGTGSSRPAVERLETIYSIVNNGESNTLPDPNNWPLVPPEPPSSQLTTSSLRHHTSLTRRPSRARRSAARNVQDAKSRGWTGRKKKKKSKDVDGASSAWTDVTWASKAPKDGQNKKSGGKCAVM